MIKHLRLYIILILLSFALVSFVLYRLWQSRPKQQALNGLSTLEQQLDRKQLDTKQCLYEINRLLRLGLQQTRLTQTEDFYHQLITLQYSADSPQDEITRQLILQARHIVRRAKP